MPRKQPKSNDPLASDGVHDKLGKAVRDPRAGKDLENLSSPIQPDQPSSEMFPIKLTVHQRESLLHGTRVKKQLVERLRSAGEGTQVIPLTRKELDHLDSEIGQAAVYARHPHKARMVAVLHKIGDLLADDYTMPVSAGTPKTRKTAPKQGPLLYQFKITLYDIRPLVWRRIQVPDGTLGNLHDHIQSAFGWEGYHLHQFEIDGERYGPLGPDEFDFGDDMLNEEDVRLSAMIPKSGRRSRWIYEYDFGDSWRHEVVFEGYPPADPKLKYPRCVEGARACPPEDCGGPWGYANYLDALANPAHEQHDDLLDWGGPFDPAAFDPKRTTQAMQKRGR